MPNVLGSLLVELRANTASFVGDLGKASHVAKTAARDISREFEGLGKIASQTFGPFAALNPVVSQLSFALSGMGRAASEAMGSFGKVSTGFGAVASLGAGVAAGLGAAGIAAIALAAHTAESAAKLNELSQSTGVSVEALSGFEFVAKQAGVSSEVMTNALTRMDKSAEAASRAPAGASNAYTRLGVSVRDASGHVRSTQAIFEDLAGKFAAMPDGVLKTASAIEIFGRGGAAIIPVLNEGSAGIQKMLDTAQRLGVVISSTTAAQAHRFEQTLGLLGAAADGASIALMGDLLSALQTVATSFTQTNAAGQSSLSQIATWTAKFVEGTLGVLDTWFHAFEQVGIVFEFIGVSIIDSIEAIIAAAKAAGKLAVFDFSGAKASAIEGLNDLKRPFDNFWDETKKTWSDNTKFINGVFNIATPFTGDVKAAPGSWPGADILERTKPRGGGTGEDAGAEGANAAAEAEKKLQSEVARVTAEFKLQIATLGQSALDVQLYKLAVDGATFSDRQHVLALAVKLQSLKDASTLTKLLATDQKALAQTNLAATIAQEGAALDDVMRAATPLPALFSDIGTSLDQNVAADLKSFTDDLKKQIAEFGKSASQLKLEQLAATPGIDPAALADAQAQFNTLAKMSESAASGVDKVSGAWKKFGDTIASGLTKAIDTGHGFGKMLKDLGKQLQEMVIKEALFGDQSGAPSLRGSAKGTSSLGSGGIFGELGHIFHPSSPAAPAGTGPASSTSGGGVFAELARIFHPQRPISPRLDLPSTWAAPTSSPQRPLPGPASSPMDESIPGVPNSNSGVIGALPGPSGGGVFGAIARILHPHSAVLQPSAPTGAADKAKGAAGPTGAAGSPFYVILLEGASGALSPLPRLGEGAPGSGGAAPGNIFDELKLPLTGEGVSSGGSFSAGGMLENLARSTSGGGGGSNSSVSSDISNALKASSSVLSTIKGVGGLFPKSSDTAGVATNGGLADLSKFPLTGEGSAKGSDSASAFDLLAQQAPSGQGPSGAAGGAAATAFTAVGAATSTVSLIANIFKIFSGFRAGGGDVSPGKAYVVGENHPEFFVPHQAGSIVPSMQKSSGGDGTHTTVVNMHVHGVQDVDSFNRSKGQIMAGFHQQASIAYARHSR